MVDRKERRETREQAAEIPLMEPIVWVPAVAAVQSALIVGGVALLIWGINTLLKMNERLSKLEAGQEILEKGQAELRQGQAKLEAGQAKLEEALYEIRRLVDHSRSSSGESP